MEDSVSKSRLRRIHDVVSVLLQILRVIDIFLVNYLGDDPVVSDSKG